MERKREARRRFFSKEHMILLLCLILQLINLFFWGNRKEGYHGDELYSYGFVSLVDSPLINEDRPGEKYLNNWHNSDYFQDYLTVSAEEAFDLKGVYHSVEQDVHPPLYYMLLHIFCSVFQGKFTKWAGLSLNFVLFVFTILMLYRLSCELFSSYLRFLPVVLYGFSVGAAGTAMMIRMYMMLTFDVLLFCYFHVRLWKNLESNDRTKIYKNYAGIFISTVIGFLTHYYFVIFAFFLCAVIWIYMLFEKKYALAAGYAAVMGAGLLGSFCLWPAMYRHIFEEYRGKEAFENFSSAQGRWAQNILDFCRVINKELFAGFGMYFVAAVLLILLGVGIWKSRQSGEEMRRSKDRTLIWIWLDFTIAAIFYVLTLARIAPYRSARYVYPIFPLLVLSVVWLVACGNKVWIIVCTAILLCLIPLGYVGKEVDHLYRGTEQKIALSEKKAEFPVILLTDQNRKFVSNDASLYFLNGQKVYPTDGDRISEISAALEQVHGESFVIYIDKNLFRNTENMLDIIREQTGAEKVTWMYATNCCRVYHISR